MKKAPSPLVSLIPIIVLVSLLFATIRTFGSDALSGGSQVSLLYLGLSPLLFLQPYQPFDEYRRRSYRV